MQRRLINLVLVIGIYAVIRLLANDEWDLAVVTAIAVATFVLDYYWRHLDETNQPK